MNDNPCRFRTLDLAELNRANERRYRITALLYDILDYPWERIYRHWRPMLVGDMRGRVLEAGVGTGRNLPHYHGSVELTALDFSPAMLRRALRRAGDAACKVNFVHEDACRMQSIPSEHYDWVMAGFLCCVIPGEHQGEALAEIRRVLRPGGRFRLLEMVYSDDPWIRRKQNLFAPLVERVYGARFDRETLRYAVETEGLRVTSTRFLKDDVYLLIEGERAF